MSRPAPALDQLADSAGMPCDGGRCWAQGAGLWQARAQSPADLAKHLKVKQPVIAKMEHRAEMSVICGASLKEGMGGRLEIVAYFPEGSVNITKQGAPGEGGQYCALRRAQRTEDAARG